MLNTKSQETNVDEQTIQNIIFVFFVHLNRRSQTQHMDLVNDFKAFMSFYPDIQGEEAEKIKKIVFQPVNFFVENNPTWFKKTELKNLDSDFTLPELDFIYFRDSSYMNQLKRSYAATYKKIHRYNKKIKLSHIINVLSYIRGVLYEDMMRYTSSKKIPLLKLPEFKDYSDKENQEGRWP